VQLVGVLANGVDQRAINICKDHKFTTSLQECKSASEVVCKKHSLCSLLACLPIEWISVPSTSAQSRHAVGGV
jgi:hypothetical protein